MPKPLKTIFSIGHSNLPLDDFIRTIKNARIDILVDVRTIPYSRYCPHFNASPLSGAVESENIQYLYRGKNLGGRGVNEGYDKAVKELTDMVRKGKRVCIMCSEGDYKKCHRHLTLTPSFEKQGLSVTHIKYENGKKTRHNR
ncbi:MAG: hypothetical protein A3G04_01790 [Candidatus Taylorbacteria bacterium RIFCSPLOWO2_12_FULL_44_9]|nr:MAG: hypothetical protein A3G04_01790 [Candidatus Taylorbacteria bacterium RIFCSPLOWO2_12_FULL_44_9]